MMTHLLNQIYSWPFLIGAALGGALWRIYCHQKAHYLDIHEPLPGGAKHQIARLNRLWVAGLALTLSLGYILLSAQNAHDETLKLAKRVTACWAEGYQATKAQVNLNAENDKISREQQELQRGYDEATSTWLKALVNPPGDLKNQPTNSLERQAWGLTITGEYQNKLNDLGQQFDALVKERSDLDYQRSQHPLPELKCGK